MNAETKFTPGPWIVECNEKSACMNILGVRGDGNNRKSDGRGHLVTVDCAVEPDVVMFSPMDAEQVANARLIAAAPKLYAALEKCRDTFDHYVSLHMAKQPPDMDKAAANQEMVELCEAALSRARTAEVE